MACTQTCAVPAVATAVLTNSSISGLFLQCIKIAGNNKTRFAAVLQQALAAAAAGLRFPACEAETQESLGCSPWGCCPGLKQTLISVCVGWRVHQTYVKCCDRSPQSKYPSLSTYSVVVAILGDPDVSGG